MGIKLRGQRPMRIVWLLLAGCGSDKSIMPLGSNDDYGNGFDEADTGDTGDVLTEIPAWWRVVADFKMEEQVLSPEKSVLQALIYDDDLFPICLYRMQIMEATSLEAPFAEGWTWWDFQVQPGVWETEDASEDTGSVTEDTGSVTMDTGVVPVDTGVVMEDTGGPVVPGLVYCDEDDNIVLPETFSLGVGELHFETLAVWDSIVWMDVSEVSMENSGEYLSAYASFDGGQTVLVYGVAGPGIEEENDSIEDFVAQNPEWWLRPAYVFAIP